MAGVVVGILSLIGYGLADYFGAISSKKIGGFQSVIISRSMSLLLLVAVFFAFFQMPQLTTNQILLAALVGLLADIGLIAFFKGFQVGNVSVVASIGNASAAVTVILLLIFFNTPLNLLQQIGVAAIILGTVLASFKLKDLQRPALTKLVHGSEYAIVSFFIWGISVFLGVILVKQLGWFMPTLLVYSFILLYNLAYALLLRISFSRVARTKSILPITAISGAMSVVGFGAFNYGVTLNYAIIVAPLSGAAPMLTVLLAFLVLKEKIEINQKIGIAMILLSIVALSFS